MEAENVVFGRIYEELGEKGGDMKFFRLAKARERKALDMDQVRCIKDEDGGPGYSVRGLGGIRRVSEILGITGALRWRRSWGLCDEEDAGEVEVEYSGTVVQEQRDKKKDLHMVFIDLENAYNKVPREVLWRCLEAKGVPVAYIRAIKDMYDRVKTKVMTVRGNSEHFPIVMGLHQGFALSPFVFALTLTSELAVTKASSHQAEKDKERHESSFSEQLSKASEEIRELKASWAFLNSRRDTLLEDGQENFNLELELAKINKTIEKAQQTQDFPSPMDEVPVAEVPVAIEANTSIMTISNSIEPVAASQVEAASTDAPGQIELAAIDVPASIPQTSQ
uniref:Reverse transcriptase domain-containing protein n=1 Tax=Nicotiana tabacum TaxID=4097 RepID=A0A1S3Y5K1_TOBAC|nr:PREDICTED: uncharacterized protein LOC107772465 [Nicotiana tabacum]